MSASVCACVYAYVCVRVCMYVSVSVCMCVRACMRVCIHPRSVLVRVFQPYLITSFTLPEIYF